QIDNRNFDWNGPQVAVLVSQKVLLHRAGFETIIGVARPDSLRIHAVRTDRSTVFGSLDVIIPSHLRQILLNGESRVSIQHQEGDRQDRRRSSSSHCMSVDSFLRLSN